MDIRKQGGYVSSATERLIAARRVKADTIARELLWAVIASHSWPSCLMEPAQSQTTFPMLLVIDSPAGRLAYRISTEELESGLFDHLEKRENDNVPAEDKIGTLWQLAHAIVALL